MKKLSILFVMLAGCATVRASNLSHATVSATGWNCDERNAVVRCLDRENGACTAEDHTWYAMCSSTGALYSCYFNDINCREDDAACHRRAYNAGYPVTCVEYSDVDVSDSEVER